MTRLIAVCILGALLVSCSQTTPLGENQYMVTGKVENLEGPCLMYIQDESMERGFRVDSIQVNDQGEFSYIGDVKTVEFLRFYPGNKSVVKATGEKSYLPSRASQFTFFAYPGARISFEGSIKDYVDAYPEDGGINTVLSKLHSQTMPIVNAESNLSLNRYIDPEADTASINKQIIDLELKQLVIKRRYFKYNPRELATGLYVLEDFRRDRLGIDEVTVYLSELKEAEPSIYTEELEKRVNAALNSISGKIAPEIKTDHTFDNSEFNLEDLKGKVVVLDYWGTWCGPCIKEMPRMKEYWQQHSDNLELVGIAEERSEKVWREFLEKNSYNWAQVINGTGSSDFVASYNVKAFPTKIIIDPEGVIVERYVGDGEKFYEKLDELLGSFSE